MDRLLEAVRLRAASGNAAQAQRLLDGVIDACRDWPRVRAEAEWTQGLLWLDDGQARDAMRALQRAVAAIDTYDRDLPLDVFITAEVADTLRGLARRRLPRGGGRGEGAHLALGPERLADARPNGSSKGSQSRSPPATCPPRLLRAPRSMACSGTSRCRTSRPWRESASTTPALELLAVTAAAALLDDAAGQAITRSWVAFERRRRGR